MSGYRSGDKEFEKNELIDWEAKKSEGDEIEIQLTFSHPIYVAKASLPCDVKICFGDGQLFRSAGFSTVLEEDTCEEMRL